MPDFSPMSRTGRKRNLHIDNCSAPVHLLCIRTMESFLPQPFARVIQNKLTTLNSWYNVVNQNNRQQITSLSCSFFHLTFSAVTMEIRKAFLKLY